MVGNFQYHLLVEDLHVHLIYHVGMTFKRVIRNMYCTPKEAYSI